MRLSAEEIKKSSVDVKITKDLYDRGITYGYAILYFACFFDKSTGKRKPSRLY
jgi:hypothetical protein